MAHVRLLLLAAAVAAVVGLPRPALGFRNVTIGGPMPAVTLDGADGKAVTLPLPGRVTVLIFSRPGQTFSGEALADLAALSPALSGKGVAIVALTEAGSEPPRAAGLPFPVLTDKGRQGWDTLGVIVMPSTAIVDAKGVLRAYVPSRNSNYRILVEAHTLRALGEISDAELTARLARAGETYGQNAEAAQAAYKRGTALAQEKRWEDAARALAEALALRPDLIEAHLQLGYVWLEMNDPAQARREFELVLTKNPSSPGARVGIGIARIRLGQVDEGIRLLEEAVVLNPEPVRGHYELGRAYEARGDRARAVSHYRWAFLKLLQGRK